MTMDNAEIAARIREALWELEGGHVDAVDNQLNALVEKLESLSNEAPNRPRPLRPSDIPDGGTIEVSNSNGEFAAYFFEDEGDPRFSGVGVHGDSVEEACRAALKDAE